jgi:hypothetical protein
MKSSGTVSMAMRTPEQASISTGGQNPVWWMAGLSEGSYENPFQAIWESLLVVAALAGCNAG